MRSSESFALFSKRILQFIRPTPTRTFNCHNPTGITLITRLRLDLSHLWDHRFKHNFLDSFNPICFFGKDIETTVHYLLRCPIFSDEKSIFISNIRSIYETVLSGSDSRFSDTLLFGISSFNNAKNASVLNTVIDYIPSTQRFDVPLTNFWFILKHLCIENRSFKFYYLNIKLFTKFLQCYIICLSIYHLICLVS